MRLTELCLSRAGAAAVRLREAADLELELRVLLDAGRAAWPGVDLPDEAFVLALAEGLADSHDPLAAVRAVRAPELYLACACARGDARALAVFDERYLTPVSARLAGRRAGSDFSDDVRQHVRTRLLVADGDRPPRITSYRGRGSLEGWLAAAMARVAFDLKRAQRDEDSLDDVVRRIGSLEVDPELGYLKNRYGREMEAALRAALSTLSARDTNLVKLYFIDGVTGDVLARMHRVTRRTIHRWLDDIRARVMDRTRQALGERLHVSATEFDSIFALVRSQIVVTLHHDPGSDESGE
jgi:RNA polymerase sigma-70 factor (ECF subfamily)